MERKCCASAELDERGGVGADLSQRQSGGRSEGFLNFGKYGKGYGFRRLRAQVQTHGGVQLGEPALSLCGVGGQIEQAGGFGNQAAIDLEAIAASKDGDVRLVVANLALNVFFVRAGNIGGIANDKIERG